MPTRDNCPTKAERRGCRRPLDTRVSLSEQVATSSCFCFICRCFSATADRCRKMSAPMTATTTTTIINSASVDQHLRANRANEQTPTRSLVTIHLNNDEEHQLNSPGLSAGANDDADDDVRISTEADCLSIGPEAVAPANNLDDVKRNFIALNRFNKLQYFFLGTLIYSAVNTCNIFDLISTDDLFSKNFATLQTPTTTNYTKSRLNQPNYLPTDLLPVKIILASNWALLLILLAILAAISYRSSSSSYEIPTERPDNNQQNNAPSRRKKRGFTSSNLLIIAGLLTTLMLFYLQLTLHLLMTIEDDDQTRGAMRSPEGLRVARTASNTVTSTSFHWTSLELTSACLLYVLPLLLEGGPLHGVRIGSLASLPPLTFTITLWLYLTYYHHRHHQLPSLSPTHTFTSNAVNVPSHLSKTMATTTATRNQIDDRLYANAANVMLLLKLSAYLALALLFGLLRRWQFIWTVIESTFAGANQLIEAKVSLEHQRQQQETLLLSVLPAYVAAQVKRNMLKTVSSSTATGLMPNHPSPPNFNNNLSSVDNSGNSGYHLIHSASSAVAVPMQHQQQQPATRSSIARSRSVDESQAGVKSTNLSVSGGAGNQRSRNPSFVFSDLLASRLASGAAYLTETLGGHSSQSPVSAESSKSKQCEPSALSTTYPMPHLTCPGSSTLAATTQARRGFNELYIRTYNNVSLLYGDIVGFTRLCTQLSSSQLVRVLNDLFSHFDHLAERHKIMRIKILGDCYYGVSGIPEFAVMGAKSRASRNDNHAINCVNMGLDMIKYIRQFNIERQQQQLQQVPSTVSVGVTAISASIAQSARKEPVIVVTSPTATPDSVGSSATRNGYVESPSSYCGQNSPLPAFELNMRIGIHTGHIHSGVIGLKKWQFDVWSNDVSIAMHCESSGIAGRIQVTEATIQQLNGAFSYERAPGSERDPFLTAKDTRTYLIRDRILPQTSSPILLGANQPDIRICSNHSSGLKGNQHSATDSRGSTNERAKRLKAISQVSGQSSYESKGDHYLEHENNIRAATIGTIRQTLLSSDECDSYGDQIDSSYGASLNYLDIKPINLSFRDPAMSRLYSHRPIENMAQELIAFCLITLLLHLVNNRGSLITIDCPLVLCIICVILTTLLLLVTLNRRRLKLVLPNSPDALDDLGLSATPEPLKNDGVFRQTASEEHKISKIIQRFVSRVKDKFDMICATTCNYIGGPKKARQVIRLTADGLASFAVILFQCYPLFQKLLSTQIDPSCANNNSGANRHVIKEAQRDNYAKERHEMTVILLLMLLDSGATFLSYKTKSLLILIIIASHSIRLVVLTLSPVCKSNDANYSEMIPFWLSKQQTCAEWSSGSLLIIMALWSLAFAHQLEYTNKANFLWRNRLNVDHEELEYISGINKVLLENILPSHVVQHYLTQPNEQHTNDLSRNEVLPSLLNYMRMSFSNMRNNDLDANKLYHEQHDGVAVMFASIPHFYEFYDESDISKQGLGCIALLNEIICDFDKLLLKNKFSRIEKIKTIGSSYMAAAGLRPCNLTARSSNASQASIASSQTPRATTISRCSNKQQLLATTGNTSTSDSGMQSTENANERRLALSQQKQNLICMIQFASSLMTALNGINKQSFQVFKLRVGVNTGSVVAGVIGAQRPFYDIWGDCVNIASRMESLGEVGRIQVEEKTATLLMESLCQDTYSIVRRGPIDVKGKGGMVTYFIDRKDTNYSAEEQKDTLAVIEANQQRADLLSPRRNNSRGLVPDLQHSAN